MLDEDQVRRFERALDASDAVVAICGSMGRREAAEAVAVALGRICAGSGRLDEAIELARIADDPSIEGIEA